MLPALLFGVALGNIVRGLPLDFQGNYTGSFFELLNPYALLFGVMGFSSFALHGALYIWLKTSNDLSLKGKNWAKKSWIINFFLMILTLAWTLCCHHYGSILLPLQIGFLALISLGMVRVFLGRNDELKAFLSSALTILLFCVTVALNLFPNMVPASNDPSLSLTVFNSSSSEKTLTVMFVLAMIGVPLVLAYTAYIYKVFAGKIK
jgi:cytochrome d ubiquinol oxidase subunit II